MIFTPIPSLDRDTIRFATPRGQITFGRILLLASLLAATTQLLFPNLLNVPPAAIWLVIAGATLIGLGLAVATGFVDIDPSTRQVAIQPGWLGAPRQIEIDAQTHIVIWSRGGTSGQVSLETPSAKIHLLVTSAEAAALFAQKLSDRLGSPIVTATTCPNSGNRVGVVMRGMAISGIACASFGLVWPILGIKAEGATSQRFRRPSGSRPQTYQDAQNAVMIDHRYTDGEHILRDILKAQPQNQDAANLLAYALSGQGKLDEALDAAMAALRLNPDAGAVVDTVGEMHELRGEYSEAVKYYKNAIQHEPDQSLVETRTKLGRTLVAMGKKKEAIPLLLHAASYQDVATWPEIARGILSKIGVKAPFPERRLYPFTPRANNLTSRIRPLSAQ